MSAEVVAAIILLIGTLTATIVTGLLVRGKVDAEGTHLLSQAAVALIAPLKVRIGELEVRMDAWEDQAIHWEAVARAGLRLYQDTYGIPPEWWKEYKESK